MQILKEMKVCFNNKTIQLKFKLPWSEQLIAIQTRKQYNRFKSKFNEYTYRIMYLI